MRGDVGNGRLNVPFDVGIGELSGSIKLGAMGYAQRDVGPHVIYLEGLGFSFEDRSLDQFRDLPVRAEAIFVEAGYGYRVPMASALPNGGEIVLMPYAGLRYASFDATVELPLRREMALGDKWIDPVLGILVEGPIRGRMAYAIKLDGAGFGLGRSRYASGALYLTCDLADRWMLGAGYRLSRFQTDTDEDDSLRMKLTASGPAIGLAYRFP